MIQSMTGFGKADAHFNGKKKRYANFIVENDGDEGELEEKLLRVLEKLG